MITGVPLLARHSRYEQSAPPTPLEHHLTAYGPEPAPSCLKIETLTIGQLASAYCNLSRRADRTAVDRSIGLTAPVLESWLQTYVRARNVCADHGRPWNVGLGIYPAIPNSPTISWLKVTDALPEQSRKRLYPVLVSRQSPCSTPYPDTAIGRTGSMLHTRPSMNLAGMGVPEDWAHSNFWRRHRT